METHTHTPTPPPLRILAALLTAKEQLCARLADLGGQFESRLLRHQVDRAQADMHQLSIEAGQIVQEKDGVRASLREAMADGVITKAEAHQIQHQVAELGLLADSHHQHATHLAS